MQEPTFKDNYEELELIEKKIDYSIYLVRNLVDREYYIAKKILIFDLDDKAQDQIFLECKVLKNLQHPHVLKYRDIYLDNQQIIVILEYCEQGDLSYYLKRKMEKKQALSEKLVLNWILQLLMALEYVHQNKIIHREINLGNIFLNSKGNLKLGSFLHSKILENTMCRAKTKIGSICYMSPEMIQDKPYNSKCDMWALGCIIYELCCYKVLFETSSMAQAYDKIMNGSLIDLPPQYMKHVYPIYKKLLKKNQNTRPSASELLRMPVFVKVMEQYIKKKKIDALQIREIPLKRLATHEKLLFTEKRKCLLPPLKKSTNTSIFKKEQKSNTTLRATKLQNILTQTPIKIEKSNSKNKMSKQNKDNSLSKRKSDPPQQSSPVVEEEKVWRLTKKQSEQQEKAIEELYKSQIALICRELELKYQPKMQQILERTVEYQQQY